MENHFPIQIGKCDAPKAVKPSHQVKGNVHAEYIINISEIRAGNRNGVPLNTKNTQYYYNNKKDNIRTNDVVVYCMLCKICVLGQSFSQEFT